MLSYFLFVSKLLVILLIWKKNKNKNKKSSTKNESKGVRVLCPTRWTVRGDTMAFFIENYYELIELWKWSLSNIKDTDTARVRGVRGVRAIMATFDFLFNNNQIHTSV